MGVMFDFVEVKVGGVDWVSIRGVNFGSGLGCGLWCGLRPGLVRIGNWISLF